MHTPRLPARSVRPAVAAVCCGCVAWALGTLSAGADQPPPASPPAPDFPADAGDETGIEADDRVTLDEFSWREFIALSWPAVEGKRGEADRTKKLGDPAADVVWGTWKSLDDLFPADADVNPPTEWGRIGGPIGVRRADAGNELRLDRIDRGPGKDAGRKYLSQVSHLKQVNEAGVSADFPIAPLVAQNGTYVRFEVRVNEKAYNFVREKGYYLAKNLPTAKNEKAVPFDSGSVIVKAAWMELTGKECRDRFYCVEAELDDGVKDGKPVVRTATVALVGLHIAQRTPVRPSWVWSSFEHVDNTEPGPGAARASFSRNDPATVHVNGVDARPGVIPEGAALPTPAKPVDVERMFGTHYLTRQTNARYYSRVKGTVWQNYRLVGTQWVAQKKDPDSGAVTKDPGDPFDAAFKPFPPSLVTNPVIETYMQGSSCLTCHRSAMDCRFVFFPSVRAVR